VTAYLTKEREVYYENLRELFQIPGYEQWMDEVLEQYNLTKEAVTHGGVSNDQIRELRGRAMVLKSMLDFQETTETALQVEMQEAELEALDEEDLDAEAVI
jgi:hypothetical protein